MKANELAVFVNSIANYFKVTTGETAVVGSPFLSTSVDTYVSDFTGEITVFGCYEGSVFFSAPRRMLGRCLRSLGLISTKDSKLRDLVGEISNTISGNARSEFGSNFGISPPSTTQGAVQSDSISNTANIYVIPIEWHGSTANLIVNVFEN